VETYLAVLKKAEPQINKMPNFTGQENRIVLNLFEIIRSLDNCKQ
jgi:hypothetical protein